MTAFVVSYLLTDIRYFSLTNKIGPWGPGMFNRLLILLSLIAVSVAGCANQPAVDQRMASSLATPYRLDAGDQLRIVVFGQRDLTNSYTVDADGEISMPLVGSVTARGRTPEQLEQSVSAALAQGYLRDPSVSVQVETYRPFFVLGEVGQPGKFTYVNELTGRRAVAMAGGFTPRAAKREIEISRVVNGRIVEAKVPLDYPILPGDTVRVMERWF